MTAQRVASRRAARPLPVLNHPLLVHLSLYPLPILSFGPHPPSADILLFPMSRPRTNVDEIQRRHAKLATVASPSKPATPQASGSKVAQPSHTS